MVEKAGVTGTEEVGAVGADGSEGAATAGGQTGGDQTGEGTDSSLIDRSLLPEEMRGKTPEQISMMWGAATRVLEAKNSESDSNNARIAALEAQIAANVEPEPDPLEGVDMKEMMLDDPVRAVDLLLEKTLEKKYGNTVARLESGIGETEIVKASRTIGPDFDQHEPKVRAILASSSGDVTEASVYGAYMMARGMAAVEDDNKRKKLSAETPAPTPEVTEVDSPTQLTGLAREIQKGSGLTEEDFTKFGEGELIVEVPGL